MKGGIGTEPTNMTKELEWKAPTIIPDGKHTGIIVSVEYREPPAHQFAYTDVIIKLDDADIKLKYGCPTTLSESSKLGRLVQIFGAKFEMGKKLNPEAILLNKRCSFMTISKKGKKGDMEFSEIVEDSLKPLA